MQRLVAFLACCVVALGAYILVREFRAPRYRPILVVEDGRSGDEQWMANILAMCPGVALGSSSNYDASNRYLLQMSFRENRWHAILWRAKEYALWVGVDPDYNKLLTDACGRLKDESEYALPEHPAERVDSNRYDLHDLRNGNIATSAILDRKTGRVWIWSKCSDCKGPEKSFFSEEQLVPSPSK